MKSILVIGGGLIGAASALRLQAAGVRAEVDARPDKIGYKVREHSLRKVPLLLAVGGREQAEQSVSLRRLGAPAQSMLSLDDAIVLCQRESAPPDL